MTALATGCSLVLYDGSPLHPHTAVMWDLVDRFDDDDDHGFDETATTGAASLSLALQQSGSQSRLRAPPSILVVIMIFLT